MTRQDLCRIRDAARVMAVRIGAGDILVSRAWWQLAAAADGLDAIVARAARGGASTDAPGAMPPLPSEFADVADVDVEDEDAVELADVGS